MTTKKKREIRTCDICGKTEFEHLKSKDFFYEPPALIVKDYEGQELKLSLQLNIENAPNLLEKDASNDQWK